MLTVGTRLHSLHHYHTVTVSRTLSVNCTNCYLPTITNKGMNVCNWVNTRQYIRRSEAGFVLCVCVLFHCHHVGLYRCVFIFRGHDGCLTHDRELKQQHWLIADRSEECWSCRQRNVDLSEACLLCLRHAAVVVVVDDDDDGSIFPHCCHSQPRGPNDSADSFRHVVFERTC